MEEFQLIRNVTIGQYIPTGSFIHRLDPRAKLIVVGAYFIALTYARELWLAALLTGLLFVFTVLARLSVRYVLRGLLPILPLVTILLLVQLLFQGRLFACEPILYEWRFIVLSPCLFEIIVLGILRVIAFLIIFSLLTLTTPASHLAHGIEMLFGPLQRIGVPVHELALAYLISLRFVPVLVGEVDRVTKAQASRGGGAANVSRWRVDKIARARLPLIVPLFISALRRAEELVIAMEARGYMGGRGRTRFFQLQSRPMDWIIAGGAVLSTIAIWWYARF